MIMASAFCSACFRRSVCTLLQFDVFILQNGGLLPLHFAPIHGHHDTLFVIFTSIGSLIHSISSPHSALFVISEIGADMGVFESAKHLCSWAGLTPANNESANKKKSTRCSKAGQYLKPLLIQCALAAVKSKKNPYYAIKYKRLAKRRGRKKAVIAIARMMLTGIYHMILNNEEWKPDDYEAIIHPSKPVKVALTLDNVIQFLGEQGADPETLKLLQQQCAVTPG